MTFSEILIEDGVVADLKSTSKKHLLQELSRLAADEMGLDPRHVLDAVLEREQLGSTGVGAGVAIPHARLENLERVIGVFARLDQPVDVDAIDDQPVDLVFLLLAPDRSGVDHLMALSRVSRAFRREDYRDKLRAAPNADALRALLCGEPDTNAA